MAIEDAAPGIEIQSIGHSLEIIKDAGGALEVNARHGISTASSARHGLGHVRLTTESIVAVAYGHPFWAEPFPDISIVHNGQLTNYFTLRRQLLSRRATASTRQRLRADRRLPRRPHVAGQTLWDALKDERRRARRLLRLPLRTPDEMGSAKDTFAIKSIVVANVGGDMAMATEEQALRAVFDRRARRHELPEPRSVYVWERSGRVTTEIV